MTVFELIEANGLNLHGDIELFANLVEAAARADEREACAKVAQETICDTHIPTGINIYGTRAAKAIRARGTT